MMYFCGHNDPLSMKATGFPQFFLRIALGTGFLLPVMDRLGLFGAPGTKGVAWGDWPHFVDYSHSLMPFLDRSLASAMGGIATLAELIFGICLIIGFKTKWAGAGSAILTFTFALFMMVSLGISAPFDYPVFVFTGGGLVLAGLDSFEWSVDSRLR
jgi:putative oxidoreductase